MYTCHFAQVIFYYIVFLIDLLMIGLIIWIMYKYIWSQRDNKSSTLVHFVGLLFYIILLLVVITGVVTSLIKCRITRDSSLWRILFSIYAILLVLHWNSLLILLFCRLYLFKLSKISFIVFIVLYCGFIGSIVTSVITYFQSAVFHSVYSDIAYATMFFFLPVIAFYTSFMFIFKL
eukprot:481106_1